MHKILILATGGTITSEVSENGLVPELTASKIVSGSLHTLPDCHIDCRDILSLDSSNIQPEEWQIIAREVAASWQNYDGIIITHGTDTMGYTASPQLYAAEHPHPGGAHRQPAALQPSADRCHRQRPLRHRYGHVRKTGRVSGL